MVINYIFIHSSSAWSHWKMCIFFFHLFLAPIHRHAVHGTRGRRSSTHFIISLRLNLSSERGCGRTLPPDIETKKDVLILVLILLSVTLTFCRGALASRVPPSPWCCRTPEANLIFSTLWILQVLRVSAHHMILGCVLAHSNVKSCLFKAT